MATFVIVHGGWGGGWEWTVVARKLRDRGHEVFTATLTGLGEREHIRPSEVTLSDHIEDVVATIKFEDLSEVVLCGHSYGGMVVTGAADRIPERIRVLVYLDAFAPTDGESLRDLIPESVDALLAVAVERGDGRAPVPEELLPPEGGRDELVLRYIERVRPQSTATMTEPVRVSGGVDRVPRVYVECTGYPDSVMGPFVARAKSEGWLYRELATEHDLQLFDPEGTAHLLDELAEDPATCRVRRA
jgi:pimeloyl-ACP methyl ester carboxylesterase